MSSDRLVTLRVMEAISSPAWPVCGGYTRSVPRGLPKCPPLHQELWSLLSRGMLKPVSQLSVVSRLRR